MAKDKSNTPETANTAQGDTAAASVETTAKELDRPAGHEGDKLRVVGPERGRMRAGLHFGPVGRVVELDKITKAQLDAIFNDPHLSVQPVKEDAPAA